MLRRLLRRTPVDPPGGGVAEATLPPPILVDRHTRTYWRPGAARTETLVEAAAPRGSTVSRRVADLLAAHDARLRQRSDADVERAATTSDPAFLEMLVVELLRAGRFDRVFDLLAPGCRSRWLAAGRFARAHATLPALLAGVEVLDVRLLEDWVDPHGGRRYSDVAELDVEYRLRPGHEPPAWRRQVHLVRVAGRWRVIVEPPN